MMLKLWDVDDSEEILSLHVSSNLGSFEDFWFENEIISALI